MEHTGCSGRRDQVRICSVAVLGLLLGCAAACAAGGAPNSDVASCSQVAAPFKETLRVETGDPYPGTYPVTVNGEVFGFPMEGFEFLVPETPDPGS